MCFCGILFLFGCTTSEELETEFLTAQRVTNWPRSGSGSKDRFFTIGEVKKVDSLEIGRVIIKRAQDGHLFSVLVIPSREIPVFSEVRIAKVRYKHNPFDEWKEFYVVK